MYFLLNKFCHGRNWRLRGVVESSLRAVEAEAWRGCSVAVVGVELAPGGCSHSSTAVLPCVRVSVCECVQHCL